MRAIEIQETGGPEVLHLVERARPVLTGPNDVLIELAAAGVNPVDAKIRRDGPRMAGGLPLVPGCDGAGTVREVGPAVTRFRPGDAVWYCYGGGGGVTGSYAEAIVLSEHVVHHKPAALDMIDAACAPLVLITAWEALHGRAAIRAGQRVLIHAGAGGVGHVAIQLAKAAGARVCTTVSGPDKAAFAHAMGAEYCINYRTEELVESVMKWSEGAGVDIAFDTVGPAVLRQSIPAVAYYGDVVSLLDPGPGFDLGEARMRNLRLGFEMMMTPMMRNLPQALAAQGKILKRCAELIERGELCIHVSRTFPLEQAGAAHALIEQGHVTGKLALLM